MLNKIDGYLSLLNKALEEYSKQEKTPKELYEPVDYIMSLGGKRLRPCLVLLACDAYGGNLQNAMPACIGVEIFHNFTLIHDDIMDKAPFRRGKATVHHKWNESRAILSGDVMMIMAYQQFEAYQGEFFRRMMGFFNYSARQVCEGQQLDMLYENSDTISLENYLEMIELKTAVLLGAALRLGAMLGNANDKNCEDIYKMGLSLGMAFQLQDDYLDSFGDEKTFGKKIGGDICENKRTYLFLKAKEIAPDKVKEYSKITDESKKIKAFQKLFKQIEVDKSIKKLTESYLKEAVYQLDKLDISKTFKNNFRAVCKQIVKRSV